MTNDQIHAAPLDAIEVHGTTRSSFLVRGALAAGAVYGATAVSPFVRQALGATGGGDVAILNFALTLEYLEAAFYRKGLSLGLSSEVRALAREFGGHEEQHVQAIQATVRKLGGKPVKMPTFSFPVKDEKSFLKLAQVLEDTGVGAYDGAAPAIGSKAVLAAAGSIVQIEARHAAAIRLRNKVTPAPAAFDAAISKGAVLKAVKPLIKG
jgi:ferritin-like protein